MDFIHGILTAQPVTKAVTVSATKVYDSSLRQHLTTLIKNAPKIRADIPTYAVDLLSTLDPAVHSIGYLVVLEILLERSDSGPMISQEYLLDKVVEFVLHFDPIQIRYYGQSMSALLEKIACGKLFPPTTAVQLLSTAILRIDPTGSLFTTTHLLLAKLAYTSNTVESALEIFDCDILFYPNMSSSKDGKPLCDPSLAPVAYISTQSGLTDTVRPATVLEYDHLRGLAYMSLGLWSKAREAFEKVISHPSKDKSVSKIMIEGHKRWILVGLLSQGKTPTVPPFTSGSANTCYKVTGRSYINLADAFSNSNAEKLKSLIEDNASLWEEDGTSSLVAEILSSYQKWQIISLRQVYQRVGISQVREMTLSAQTSKPLENDGEALSLIRQMIESGMLDGHIEQDGSESYLSFQDDDDVVSEAQFARQIAQSHHTIELLGKHYQAMNDRLTGSKEYVKHLVREQKRAEKDVTDAGIGFDSQIEDEDLMAGILPHT